MRRKVKSIFIEHFDQARRDLSVNNYPSPFKSKKHDVELKYVPLCACRTARQF